MTWMWIAIGTLFFIQILMMVSISNKQDTIHDLMYMKKALNEVRKILCVQQGSYIEDRDRGRITVSHAKSRVLDALFDHLKLDFVDEHKSPAKMVKRPVKRKK